MLKAVFGVTPVGGVAVCQRSPPGDAKVRLSAAFGAWPAECRKGLCRGQVEVFHNGSQVNSACGFAGLCKVSGAGGQQLRWVSSPPFQLPQFQFSQIKS